MAGLIRVRSTGPQRRRAGLAFTREWTELDGMQVNEAQYLAILEDAELELEKADDAENPEWEKLPDGWRENGIEVLRDHVAYDIEHGRPHDMMVGRAPDDTQFQSALGGEGRSETGAPVSGAPEPKDGTGTDDNAAPSADPQGGEPSSADGSQESREGTDDGATAREASPDGEKQPEDSLQPPVAEPVSASTAAPKKPAGSHRRKA